MFGGVIGGGPIVRGVGDCGIGDPAIGLDRQHVHGDHLPIWLQSVRDNKCDFVLAHVLDLRGPCELPAQGIEGRTRWTVDGVVG